MGAFGVVAEGGEGDVEALGGLGQGDPLGIPAYVVGGHGVTGAAVWAGCLARVGDGEFVAAFAFDLDALFLPCVEKGEARVSPPLRFF